VVLPRNKPPTPEPPLDPAEHDAFKRGLLDEHHAARDGLDAAIEKLTTAFQQYDPFPVIAELSIQNCFIDPETYFEPAENRSEALVEYVQSLALAVQNPGTTSASVEWIDDCCALAREILDSTEFYFFTEFAEEGFDAKYPGVEAEVRMLTVMRTLKMRGDSVQEHHEDLFVGLFAPHDDFLQMNFGFSASELIRATHEIDERLGESVFGYIEAYAAMLGDLRAAFETFVAARYGPLRELGEDTLEELRRQFFLSDSVAPFRAAQRATRERVADLFVIEPSSVVTPAIIEFLSADIATNSEFLIGKGKGWPLADTVIRRKPLVRRDRRTYAFNPLLLSRFLIDGMESAIRDIDRRYFDEKYLSARGKYLEQTAVEHLAAVLPGATVYRNLTYNVIEAGQTKGVETDAVIMFDHYLFILEAKAGGVTAAAHRGAMPRIKEHLESLIVDAARQGFRTRDYIATCPQAHFVDASGVAVAIPNLAYFDGAFVITPTLTPLAYFATRLPTVCQLADLPRGAWPWSVFLNDLRVASEVFESPAEFVLYLERRLLINETANIATPDELDLVMYFLRHGMFFGNKATAEIDPMVLNGYTVDLDRYYSFKGGRASSGEKPRFNISAEMRALVNRIEAEPLAHRTYAAVAFLSLDTPTQQRVLSDIVRLGQMMRDDGEEHTLTLSAGAIGYSVSVIPESSSAAALKRLHSYRRMKKHQWKMNAWVHLSFIVAPDGTDTVDLSVDTRPWSADPELDKEVAQFQRQKVSQAVAAGKVGRNEPCPCNSGHKFKKCCGIG
jgi:hypothetical protein